MNVAGRYDLINALLFGPGGGSRRLRARLVEALEVAEGQQVLELGCGSGQVTQLLTEHGATVVAVDALEGMLETAKRRAPGATFVCADLLAADLGTGHDRVVLSFVLHNFEATNRVEVLQRAADVVRADGQVGILEWAEPGPGLKGRLWRRFLHRLEPSTSVGEILDGGLDRDLTSAGLRVTRREALGGARVQLVVAVASGAVCDPPAGASPGTPTLGEEVVGHGGQGTGLC